MKTVYINLTNYGKEYIIIHGISEDLKEIVKSYKKSFRHYMTMGIDDLFGLHIVSLEVSDEDYEKLLEVRTGEELYDDEFDGILVKTFEPEFNYILTSDVSTINDMVELVCDEFELSPEEGLNKLISSKKVYNEYITSYIENELED